MEQCVWYSRDDSSKCEDLISVIKQPNSPKKSVEIIGHSQLFKVHINPTQVLFVWVQ